MAENVSNEVSGRVDGTLAQLGNVTGNIDMGGPDSAPLTSARGSGEQPGPGAVLASVKDHIRSRLDTLAYGRPHTEAVMNELQAILRVAEGGSTADQFHG